MALPPTRRDLLRRGVAAGVAASSAPLLLVPGVPGASAAAGRGGDEAILMSALGVEHVAVFAYAFVVRSGRLDRSMQKVARLLGAQEQEHADGLTTALRAVGGTPPRAPTTVAEVDRALGSLGIAANLGSLGDQKQIATFAIELELATVASYYDALQKIENAELLATCARIMANEGQHLVVLRSALGHDPVPNAFESGRASA